MKKALIFLIISALALSFTACGKTAEPTDGSAVTITDESTNSTTEETTGEETTSSEETTGTETTATEATTPEGTTAPETTKPKETTPSKSNTDSGKKPAETKPQETTKAPETKAPETKAPETKPAKDSHFVRVEFVEKKYYSTTTMVDGMNLIDRLYGKDKAMQVGDYYKCRIVMSDGSVPNVKINDCSPGVSINGNIVTVKAELGIASPYFDGTVTNSDGSKSSVFIQRMFVVNCNDNSHKDLSGNLNSLFRDYCEKKGMTYHYSGSDFQGYDFERGLVDIKKGSPNYNPNWIKECFDMIDKFAAKGYNRCSLVVIMEDGFSIIADKNG